MAFQIENSLNEIEGSHELYLVYHWSIELIIILLISTSSCIKIEDKKFELLKEI